ncbi:hypothetical protein YC2023_023224 [Brassica napus]
MPHISTHVNRVVYFSVFCFMEFSLLPVSSSTLCSFGVGNVFLKIRDTSNTKVLIKGFVTMLKIVDCALFVASILGFISLIVVFNFQGFISLYSSMVTEIRGLLDIISCLCPMYANANEQKKLNGRHSRYALALDLETIWAQRPLLLLTSITTINKIMDIFMEYASLFTRSKLLEKGNKESKGNLDKGNLNKGKLTK